MTYNVVRVSLSMLLIVAQRKRVVYSTKLADEFADLAMKF